jgi:hypothetical protein
MSCRCVVFSFSVPLFFSLPHLRCLALSFMLAFFALCVTLSRHSFQFALLLFNAFSIESKSEKNQQMWGTESKF